MTLQSHLLKCLLLFFLCGNLFAQKTDIVTEFLPDPPCSYSEINVKTINSTTKLVSIVNRAGRLRGYVCFSPAVEEEFSSPELITWSGKLCYRIILNTNQKGSYILPVNRELFFRTRLIGEGWCDDQVLHPTPCENIYYQMEQAECGYNITVYNTGSTPIVNADFISSNGETHQGKLKENQVVFCSDTCGDIDIEIDFETETLTDGAGEFNRNQEPCNFSIEMDCPCDELVPDDGCALTRDTIIDCEIVNIPIDIDDDCRMTYDSVDIENCMALYIPIGLDDDCELTNDYFLEDRCVIVNEIPDVDDGCDLTKDSFDLVNCLIVNEIPDIDDGCYLTTDSFDYSDCTIVNEQPNIDDGCDLTIDSFDSVNCVIINEQPNVDDNCELTIDSFDPDNCVIINAYPNVDDGCDLTIDSFDVGNCVIVNEEPNIDDGCDLTIDSFDSANCVIINAYPNVDDGCDLTVDSFDPVNCVIINAYPDVDDGCDLTVDSFDPVNCVIINAYPNVDDGCDLTVDSFDPVNCVIINAYPDVDDGCDLTVDSFDPVNCIIINAYPDVNDGCDLTVDSFDAGNCVIVNEEPNIDDGCDLTIDSFDSANCVIINTNLDVDDGCDLTVDSFDPVNCVIINAYPDVDDGCDLTVDSFDPVNCVIINAYPDVNDGCDLTVDSFDAVNCVIINAYPDVGDGCDLTVDSFDPDNCVIINAYPDVDDGCDLTVDSFDLVNCLIMHEAIQCNDQDSCTQNDIVIIEDCICIGEIADIDEDGICDSDDNCPTFFNPDQLNCNEIECVLINYIQIEPISPFSFRLSFLGSGDSTAFVNKITGDGYNLDTLQAAANNLNSGAFIASTDFTEYLGFESDTIDLYTKGMENGLSQWEMIASTSIPLGGTTNLSAMYTVIENGNMETSGCREVTYIIGTDCNIHADIDICTRSEGSNSITVNISGEDGPYNIAVAGVGGEGFFNIVGGVVNLESNSWSDAFDTEILGAFVFTSDLTCWASGEGTFSIETSNEIDEISVSFKCDEEPCILIRDLVQKFECNGIPESSNINISSPSGEEQNCNKSNDAEEYCFQDEGEYIVTITDNGEIITEVTVNITIGQDTDGNGICDEDQDCVIGTPCEVDLDCLPSGSVGFTDADCNCISLPQALNDIDNDGVCNDVDNCPNNYNPNQGDDDGDGLGNMCDNDHCDVGEICIDESGCMINTTIDENCNCVGEIVGIDQDNDGFCGDQDPDDDNPCEPNSIDLDGDGVCDGEDTYPLNPCLPNGEDSDFDGVCDEDDPYPDNPCLPNGEDFDLDGVCDEEDCHDYNPNIADGFSCDDGNPCTKNDIYIDCECIGEIINNCEFCVENAPCDDGSPCTQNDKFNSDCICLGEVIAGCYPCYNDGICDDGNPCTTNDVFDENCNCIGSIVIGCNDCESGMPCDDGDPCTSNDTFDEKCNCNGIISNPIIIELNGSGDCNNPEVTLVANGQFVSYEWSIEGRVVGREKILTTFLPGNYLLKVQDEFGCIQFISKYAITNFAINEGAIESDGDILCGDNDNLTLSIPSDLEPIEWILNGEIIAGNLQDLNISKSGLYFAKVISNGCEVILSKEIQSSFDDDFRILPDNAILCSLLDKIELSINEIDDSYRINWEFDDLDDSNGTGYQAIPDSEQLDKIEIDTYGRYKVIIQKDGCSEEIVKEVKKPETGIYREILLQKGFIEYQVEVISGPSFKPNDNDINRQNVCNSDIDQPGDYTIEFISSGDQIKIKEDILERVDVSCSCDIKVSGIFMDNFCEILDKDINYFVEYANEFEGVYQVYIEKAEEGETTSMYVLNSLESQNELDWPSDQFKEAVNNIICGRHENKQNLVLEDLPGVENNIWYHEDKPLFDGINYHISSDFNPIQLGGLVLGAHIGNYFHGETIDLDYTIDIAESWNFKAAGHSYTIPGNFVTFKFYYLNDIYCEKPLQITFNKSFEDSFGKLLNDPTPISKMIFDNKDLAKYDLVPACLYTGEKICILLNDEEIINGENGAEAVLNLLNVDDPEIAQEVLNCSVGLFDLFQYGIEEKNLINAYTGGYFDGKYDLFTSSGEHASLFKVLLDTYYKTGWNNLIETKDEHGKNFYLSGGRIGPFGTLASANYQGHDFIANRNNFHLFDLLGDPVDVEAPDQNKKFNYYDEYLVKLDESFAFFPNPIYPIDDGEYVLVRVPGVYMAYAINRRNAGEVTEDIHLAINLATVLVGVGTFNTLLQSGRLASATGFFAGADVTLGTAHILLDESTFCEDLPTEYKLLCDKYKKVLPYLDLIFLGGTATASKMDKVTDVRNAYEGLNPTQVDNLMTNLTSKYGADEAADLMRLLRSAGDLLTELHNKFPKIRTISQNNGRDIFAELIQINPNAAKIKQFESQIKALDGLGGDGSIGFKFVDDLVKTSLIPGKIGKELGNLNGGWVKAWKDLFNFPNLRIKTNHLEAYDVFKTTNNVTPKVTKDEIIEVLEELGNEVDQIKYLEHLDEFNKGNRQWGHVDYTGGPYNGNSQATFFDVRVSYQSNRPQVGVAFSQNNILEWHLNIPQNLQQQTLATNIFKRMKIDYNPSKVKGNWKTIDIYSGGESVNLTIFKQKLSEGLTPQAAAFETPTGKIMKQNGFGGTPTIITNTADEVVVHFNPG